MGAACSASPPVRWIAVEVHLNRFAGVILQSPLTSVISVVSSTLSHFMPADMFNNISKIDRVKCPVLIMHGTEDAVVPFDHGKVLPHHGAPYGAPPRGHPPQMGPGGQHRPLRIVFLGAWVGCGRKVEVIRKPAPGDRKHP